MHNQASQPDARVEWFHPGEVVIVARVPRGSLSDDDLRAGMRDLLGRHARAHVRREPESLRSFVFDAPTEPQSLVFFVQQLSDVSNSRAVKTTVEALHGQLNNLRINNLEVIGAMPQWHLKAHEAFSGGSPGSRPAPVFPEQVRGRSAHAYRPAKANLNLAEKARGADPVSVAILDTRIDLAEARRRAEGFKASANNHQLIDTIEALEAEPAADEGVESEWRVVRQHHADGVQAPGADAAAGRREPAYRMADHGLFVAGLVHEIAPLAGLTYEAVLDETGVGDLSLLLMALKRVLGRKQPDEPQIINLSLGFRPHPARMAAAWYGLARPHDQLYTPSAALFDRARDERWVARNRGEVGRTVDMLQAGLGELGRYLSLNNCLVVAAAGNDSQAGDPRLDPRLPARFDSVLGVAATVGNPPRPAVYSNLGDDLVLGDHVATFGGGVDGLAPHEGVVGVYSGEFPTDGKREPRNETGWAYWSGTSFATAIVSGIAANFWAVRRKEDPGVRAAEILADFNAEASASGPFVRALRTPAIEVEGDWVG
jgi:hypothetical protein